MNRLNHIHRLAHIVHQQMEAAERLLKAHHPDQVGLIYADSSPYIKLLNSLYADETRLPLDVKEEGISNE